MSGQHLGAHREGQYPILDLGAEERKALQAFLLKSTLPVLYDWEDKGIDQIATGTLLCLGTRYFLVTSRHLFRDKYHHQYDPARLAFPATALGKAVFPFGNSILYLPSVEKVDIAILEITEQETVSRLSSGWRILSEKNLGPASGSGTYVLSGYPSSEAVKRGDLLGGTLVTIFTEIMRELSPEVRPEPDPGIDLFFHLDEEGEQVDGSMANVPALQGMSGASVWKVLPNENAIWTPESALRIIGVQSAYQPAKYFRAINWTGALEIFRRIDAELGRIVEAALLPP